MDVFIARGARSRSNGSCGRPRRRADLPELGVAVDPREERAGKVIEAASPGHALPDQQNAPPQHSKLRDGYVVALHVALKLGFPELRAR